MDQLSARARSEFCAAVGAALDEIPAPAPRDDSHLQRLHRIWSAARRRAFEKVIAGME